MPPYASRSLISNARSSQSFRRALRPRSVRRVKQLQAVYRNASTSTTGTTKPPDKDVLNRDKFSALEGRDALLKIRPILASALRLRGKRASGHESQPLLEPLAEASDSLSALKGKRSIRVAVHSEEERPARDLVTVLLDDPLSSDSSFRSVLRERCSTRDGRKTILQFQQDKAEASEKETTPLPSPFFSRFSSPVTLQELPPDSSFLEVASHLLGADILILVVSPPYTPPPSLISIVSSNPHALLVVDGTFDSSSPSADTFRLQMAEKYDIDASQVLLVDTARALRGAEALSADPSSAPAVRSFQEDMLSSGIPKLLSTLSESVSIGSECLRLDTQRTVTSRALEATMDVIHHAEEETRHVRSRTSALQEEVLEARERAEVEILGGDADVVVMQKGQSRVVRGIEKVREELKGAVDGLAWYRLPFIVDDVSVRIDRAVERAFAREFENELIFHTGRLASLQAHFIARTTSFLASLPPIFHSAILQNTLEQITSSPSFPITHSSPSPLSPSLNSALSTAPPALLTPLRNRTVQLAHATRALHLTAQRLLLITFTNTSLSTLASSLLYVHTSIDASTCLGIGLLGTLAGLRWVVGRWANARAKWWSSFGRVGEGLERDLRGVVGGVLDERVCVVTKEACEGVKRAVERREKEVGEVLDEVERFEADLEGGIRDEGGERNRDINGEKKEEAERRDVS